MENPGDEKEKNKQKKTGKIRKANHKKIPTLLREKRERMHERHN